MGAKMSSHLDESPISETTLRAMLLEYRRVNWHGIQPPAVQEQIVEDLIHDDSSRLFAQIAPYVKLTEASRILDIGSGVGSLVVACRKRGFSAVGVEPDRIGQGAELNAIQIARRRTAASVFVNGIGEMLPFADACFDLVTMNQVIEHVSDQETVIREAARVVREGGIIYIACPNYLRFYEPHYKIFWWPMMPKRLGRLYLRLRRRSPAMLDQLTYTTNRRLRELCALLGPGYTLFDLHGEDFKTKRSSGSFAARSTRVANRLTKLPVVGQLVLWAVLKYGSIREGGCAMVIIRNSTRAQQC
jgi:SAM-dependent methyltransferase